MKNLKLVLLVIFLGFIGISSVQAASYENSSDANKNGFVQVRRGAGRIEPYESDPDYISAYEDANKYCNSQDVANYDSAKCTEAQNKMNKIKLKYSSNADTYTEDSNYIKAYEDANKYCNPQDVANYDSTKCTEAQNKMNEIKSIYESELDLYNFCTGNVQGVFTAIGWGFFMLKIIVPLILVVLGSIDLGKAVLASKEDEIKKAASSLIKKVAIGALIFFIPTIISFVVNLIDNDNVYKGTFGNCTKCMLDPNYRFKDGSTCKNIRGD